MNISSTNQMMQNALNSLKKRDHIVVRKSFTMKDTVYKKNEPDCEMFHSEIAFDHDVYLMVLLLAVTGVITYAALCRIVKKCYRRGHCS